MFPASERLPFINSISGVGNRRRLKSDSVGSFAILLVGAEELSWCPAERLRRSYRSEGKIGHPWQVGLLNLLDITLHHDEHV